MHGHTETALIIFMWYMSLVCRDINLENILLDKDGHCKLADFRVSKIRIFHGLKITNICGTTPYMALEVIITSYFKCDTFSFKFHLLSFRRSVQNYKIHMNMEIVIFLEAIGETNLEVYSNHMIQYSIWGFIPIQII